MAVPSTYSDVGMVRVGEQCRVASDDNYFYISAKDISGNPIVSKDIELASSVSVSAEDLY